MGVGGVYGPPDYSPKSNSILGEPFMGHYLTEGAMELPPAHDKLGLFLANALQAAQISG